MRRSLKIGTPIASLVLLGAVLFSRYSLSSEKFERHIQNRLPAGSSRAQVMSFLKSEPVETDVAAFDYQEDNPWHGRALIVKCQPRFPSPTLYAQFYFNKQQKLLFHRVSSHSQPPLFVR